MQKSAFYSIYLIACIRAHLCTFVFSFYSTHKHKLKLLFYTSLILILNVSCSEKTRSPEDEIKQYIESGKIAAENRNHSELADLINEQYRDQKGWDKKRIKNMARAYFLIHQNIYLLTKIDNITFQNKNNAFVVLYVAMAGTAINDLNAINRLRAKVYKFELQLIKNDSWLLHQAKWKAADIRDML